MRKSLLRTLVLLCSIYALGSCSSYQNITKTAEPTIEDFKTKIIPGKDYRITFKKGYELYVDVTKVDSVKIYGQARGLKTMSEPSYAFEETHENLSKNVTQIVERKFAPLATFGPPMFVLLVYLGLKDVQFGVGAPL